MRAARAPDSIAHPGLWLRSVTGLLVLAGCADSGPAEPAGGAKLDAVVVRVASSGYSPDPDGYTVLLDGKAAGAASRQDTIGLRSVTPGEHTIALSGVASNCRAEPSSSQLIRVREIGTPPTAFTVDCDSVWSNIILFTRGNLIMQANVDGTGAHALFEGRSPSVSPDRRHVATTTAGTVARRTVDGLAVQQLTPSGSSAQFPAWSPDGNLIAFTSDRSGSWQLYTMRSDGTEQRRLTWSDRQETGAHWSPDSRQILIARVRSGSSSNDIIAVRADGSGERNVLSIPGASVTPSDWSPDGSRILFNSTEGDVGNRNWVMDSDGTNRRVLHTGYGYFARWSPSGGRIVFSRQFGSQWEVVAVDSSGVGGVTLLPTPGASADLVEDWLP